MAKTKAQLNREIRQEALRQQLAQQKHIEKVVDNINKIEQLEIERDGEEINYKSLSATQFELQKLKTANEQRMKLINKYLPDLKSQEITGEGGGPVSIKEVGKMTDEQLEQIIGNQESGS